MLRWRRAAAARASRTNRARAVSLSRWSALMTFSATWQRRLVSNALYVTPIAPRPSSQSEPSVAPQHLVMLEGFRFVRGGHAGRVVCAFLSLSRARCKQSLCQHRVADGSTSVDRPKHFENCSCNLWRDSFMSMSFSPTDHQPLSHLFSLSRRAAACRRRDPRPVLPPCFRRSASVRRQGSRATAG